MLSPYESTPVLEGGHLHWFIWGQPQKPLLRAIRLPLLPHVGTRATTRSLLGVGQSAHGPGTLLGGVPPVPSDVPASPSSRVHEFAARVGRVKDRNPKLGPWKFPYQPKSAVDFVFFFIWMVLFGPKRPKTSDQRASVKEIQKAKAFRDELSLALEC